MLEYFDVFLIGLTAIPTKKTIGFFNQNLVSEYTFESAVVDNVNMGYDIYRITNSSGTNLVALQCAPKGRAPGTARDKTELAEQGNNIEAEAHGGANVAGGRKPEATGTAVEIRDRLTKQKRLEVLDQQEDWLAQQLERDQNLRSRFRKYLMNREAVLKCSVLAPNQIHTATGAKRRVYLVKSEGILKCIQVSYEQMKGRGTCVISCASFRKKLTWHNLIGAVKGADTFAQIEM